MSFKTYIKQAFTQKLLVFSIIWGILAALFSSDVVAIITIIEKVTSFLLMVFVWALAFPGVVVRYLPFIGNNTLVVVLGAIGIAILLSPIAYKVWTIFKDVLRRIPWWG
jgi:hypothetical protein